MITIVMDIDKNIRATTSAAIHQFESNSDEIMCLLPSKYGSILLSECSVKLCFLNCYGKGGQIDLSGSEYNASHLKYTGALTLEMTISGGDLTIWIEAKNKSEEFVLKSNSASINVVKSISLDENSANEMLPILNQWMIQMTQTKNEALNVLRQATEQANRATKAASVSVNILEVLQNKGGE